MKLKIIFHRYLHPFQVLDQSIYTIGCIIATKYNQENANMFDIYDFIVLNILENTCFTSNTYKYTLDFKFNYSHFRYFDL